MAYRGAYEEIEGIMRQSPRRARYINPKPGYSTGLQRSRSNGHAPSPVVNVYNDLYQDTNLRSGQSQDPYLPALCPPAPEYRDRRSPGIGVDFLAGEFVGMELERAKPRRSGRSDTSEMYPWEFIREKQQLEDIKRRRALEKLEERFKTEYEIRMLRQEAQRKEAERKRNEDEERLAEAKKRWISDYEEKKREDAEKAKVAEKAAVEKFEREKREAKEREEREYKEFLRLQEKKKEKKKREEEEEEEKIEEGMRRRLRKLGYPEAAIAVMVEAEKKPATLSSTSLELYRSPRAPPTYPKVHRSYLDVETLVYYGVPYEWDPVSSIPAQECCAKC